MKKRKPELTDLIATLNDLIAQKVHILNDKNNHVEIIEDDNVGNKGLKKVKIIGITDFYFAFKLDDKNFPFLGKLLKDGSFRKAVDAILFCNVKGKDYIFLIEMKSNDTKGVTLKYRSTKIFLQFLETTLEKLYGNSILDTFEVRSILFDRKPTSKGKEVKPRTPSDETFYHQGFGTIADNETRINKFIK